MKAAVLEKGKLEIREVPKPEPKYEEALIKLTAAGVCHSDLHLLKDEWPLFSSPHASPLGHEGIGVIEALGPGAEKFVQVGDRVIVGLGGVGAGGYWCGACEYCLSGKPRLCSKAKGIIGCYGEYVSVWVKSLVKLPDTVPDTEVPLACGGLTAYSAVKKLISFQVVPGKPIAIIGAAGGLGHYAVQVAKAFGYKVVGIDLGQQKIDFIKGLGADYAVDAQEAARFVKDKVGGVSASIVFSVSIESYNLGLKILRRSGLFISVGIPAVTQGVISITPFDLFLKDPTIICSAVGTVEEMRELIQLAADGKVRTHVGQTANLSEINQLFESLAGGKTIGRAIITNMQQ